MARREARPRAERERVPRPLRRCCPDRGRRTPIRYENRRAVAALDGPVRPRLKVRRCEDAGCVRHHRPFRPEAEGAIALPRHEFGLDVIAPVGALRYASTAACRRSAAPCASAAWRCASARSPTCSTATTSWSRRWWTSRGAPPWPSRRRVVLAIDGLQPDVGHEVLWVVRDCLSGQVLLARSLLSAAAADLAGLLREVRPRSACRSPGW